jgi:hypothetical protein
MLQVIANNQSEPGAITCTTVMHSRPENQKNLFYAYASFVPHLVCQTQHTINNGKCKSELPDIIGNQ